MKKFLKFMLLWETLDLLSALISLIFIRIIYGKEVYSRVLKKTLEYLKLMFQKGYNFGEKLGMKILGIFHFV